MLAEIKRDAGFAARLFTGAPFSVLIQITNRCNMSCGFCGFYQNAARPEQELALSDFRRLEGELTRMGRFMVSLEGGEPLLRPDLAEIIRIFSERHLPLLFTNGWLVTAGRAAELFDAGLTQVGVSLDYPDAARHDALRGLPGAFDRALAAISHLKGAAPHGGKQVHVLTVLMQDNRDDLETLLGMTRDAGIGHVITLLSRKGFRRAQSESEGPEPIGAPASQWLGGLWSRYPHIRFFSAYSEHVDDFLSGDRARMPRCNAGKKSLNIDHLGNVSPCIEKIDRSVGSIRDEALGAIFPRMAELDWIEECQDCWTCCRGAFQFMGPSGGLRGLRDLRERMRSW